MFFIASFIIAPFRVRLTINPTPPQSVGLTGCNNVAPLYAWEENTVKLRMMLHQETM